MTVLRLSGLRRNYQVFSGELGFKSLFSRRPVKTVHALKGIDLALDKGEICGFVGPNGSGKSTTIKILCGILRPTEGAVEVLGMDPFQERYQYTKRIGLVLAQKTLLNWDLPPKYTFGLYKHVYGIQTAVFEKKLAFFEELLGGNGIFHRPVRNLSLGERMKCEIVASLLHEPEIIFLDEPTIGLDVLARSSVMSFIKDYNARYGTTFFIASHDISLLEQVASRFVLLSSGQIVFDGSADKLRKFTGRLVLKLSFAKSDLETIADDIRRAGYDATVSGDSVHLQVDPAQRLQVIKTMLPRYELTGFESIEPGIEDTITRILKEQAPC